jgi:SAM-dependent methyltransferase
MTPNPYDELPYRSIPIEWSAPERLALASLLHGGPRAPTDGYRVLELGCGNGANLLPLAYYRPDATFVGVDGAGSAMEVAQARRSELALSNVELVHADFLSAADRVSGPFDYILAHGVFSWVPDGQRDALLALCARHLRPAGLLYLNYNAKPGWNVRGMVRDFLRAQTARTVSLRARAALAQEIAAKIVASFAAAGDHPYSRLMEGEFRLVCDGHVSYVAHEYLADDNRAYWRSEFLALAGGQGLEYLADADFNYASGRTPVDLPEKIAAAGIIGQPPGDTVDLLCYRQLHSPILTNGTWARREPSATEYGDLHLASCLTPVVPDKPGHRMFHHPSGFEVEAKTEAMAAAFERLRTAWPAGLRVGALFPEVAPVMEDLRLLHRHGLLELRLVEPNGRSPPPALLNAAERRWAAGYLTTPTHTREGQPT